MSRFASSSKIKNKTSAGNWRIRDMDMALRLVEVTRVVCTLYTALTFDG